MAINKICLKYINNRIYRDYTLSHINNIFLIYLFPK